MKTYTLQLLQFSAGSWKLTPVLTPGIEPEENPQTGKLQIAIGGNIPPTEKKTIWTDHRNPPRSVDGKFMAVDLVLGPPGIGRETKPDANGRALILFNLDYHGVIAEMWPVIGHPVFVAQRNSQVLLVVSPRTIFRFKARGVSGLKDSETDFALVFLDTIDQVTVVEWNKYQTACELTARRKAAEDTKSAQGVPAVKKPMPVVVAAQQVKKVQPKPQPKPQVQQSVIKKNWVTLGDGERKSGFADLSLKDIGLVMDGAIAEAQAKPPVNTDELVCAK